VETVLATARTAAERDLLADAILDKLPWPTPRGESDRAFAGQAAAGSQGGLAAQIASWLNIDRHLEAYGRSGTFSDEEQAAISLVRSALRRIQVPAGGVLLAAAVLQALTCG
jgi:hypothetical protein